MNFYICEHCNKIVIHMKNSGLPTACCGEKMKLLVPTREGASEKHLPQVKVEGNKVTISVGEIIHPMSEEHLIEWIALETSNGIQYLKLFQSDEPKAEFMVSNRTKLIAAYAYCNLHGLWKYIF